MTQVCGRVGRPRHKGMQNSTAGESHAAEQNDKQFVIDPERAELDDDPPVTHAVKGRQRCGIKWRHYPGLPAGHLVQ